VIRLLLVTEATRSIGEFRRPMVRRSYLLYAHWYRRAVTRVVKRLIEDHEVTVLGARQLVDASALPPTAAVHYYDEEAYAVDSRELESLTRRLVAGWWQALSDEPDLSYRGVWLPDLLTVGKRLRVRLEVVERLGIIARVLDEVKPDQLRLLSGASVTERAARLVARARGLGVRRVSRSLWPHLTARAYAALFPREDRINLRDLLRQQRHAPAPQRGDGPRILFVTCRSRHHLVVDPLIEAVRVAGASPGLVAQSDKDPELAARVNELSVAGVPTAYLMDYLPQATAARLVRRFRPLFRRALRRAKRDPELAERVSWRGVSLWPVLRPFLAASGETSLLAALLAQEAAFRALRAIRPDALIVTSDRRLSERAMAFLAHSRGIPSLLFSGTLVLPRDLTSRFDIGDRLVVIGEHLRQSLVRELGIDPERVSVVGDPRSNAARLVPTARLREEVRHDFSLAPDRPLVIFLSKYVSLLFSAQEREAFYRTMVAAARQLSDVDFIVKVHPNEDLARLREQVDEWGWPEALLTKDYDIHRLFGAADAAVMVTSMAGLEAMALGCPVVAVQTAGKDFEGEYMPAYVSAGAVRRVDVGKDAALADTLRRLLWDPAERQDMIERGRAFSARYVHPVDGRLGERLLALAEEISAARSRS
jgi:glycosyltransferase involved in cell wall biosynthesis